VTPAEDHRINVGVREDDERDRETTKTVKIVATVHRYFRLPVSERNAHPLEVILRAQRPGGAVPSAGDA
jgi:hypothetical protein